MIKKNWGKKPSIYSNTFNVTDKLKNMYNIITLRSTCDYIEIIRHNNMAIGLTAICISQWVLKLMYYYTIGYALIDTNEKNIKKTMPK